MTQERLHLHLAQVQVSLRKIREVLRLKHEVGLSNRAIAQACRVSNSTVGDYLERAQAAGVAWPVPDELGEEALYRKLFPDREDKLQTEHPIPNWEEVHRELSRQGVTRMLLWQEYREKHPEGYGRTQFFEHYQRWNQTHTTSLRSRHASATGHRSTSAVKTTKEQSISPINERKQLMLQLDSFLSFSEIFELYVLFDIKS